MTVRIEADVRQNVNFAICQHKRDLVSGLVITGVPSQKIPVRITGSPEFIADDGLFYVEEGISTNPHVRLDNRYFQHSVIEARQAFVNIEVLDPADEDKVLEKRQYSVNLQAYLHWYGTGSNSYSLALFVTPEAELVKRLVEKAGRAAREKGFFFAQDPGENTRKVYEEENNDYAEDIAREIYDTLLKEGISYVNPPASFDIGQKVRIPQYVLSDRGRQGTCLDLAVLMAACLEAAGLYSVVVLVPGHAFSGVWLHKPESWVQAYTYGKEAAWRINKACSENSFLPIECTTFAGNRSVSFDDAAHLYGDRELAEFEEMVDLKAAREAGMQPVFQDFDESDGQLDDLFEKVCQTRELYKVTIEAAVASEINFSRDFRGDRIVRNLIVSGTSGVSAGVRIRSESGFLLEREQDFNPQMDGLAFQPVVILNEDYYRRNISIEVEDYIIIEVFNKNDESILEKRIFMVLLKPYMYWDAAKFRDTLPAFLQPNASLVSVIQKRATQHCRAMGILLCGYQSENRMDVLRQAECIYKALAEQRFFFESLQPDYENNGHIIRIPEYIGNEGYKKTNALDLAILFASCLEQAGLFSVLLIQKQTVAVGLWLDPVFLKNYYVEEEAGPLFSEQISKGKFAAIDCNSLAAASGQISFAAAKEKGRVGILRTVYAMDVMASRLVGIDPVFTYSSSPICALPFDVEEEERDEVDEMTSEVFEFPTYIKPAVPKKRNVVFCILQGDSRTPVSRHINSSLQWMQDYYRQRKDTEVREAFVYHKRGNTSAKGFAALDRQDYYYIDLSEETHETEYTKLAPLYFLAVAMLENRWKKDKDGAEYEIVVIVNKTIEANDAAQIFGAVRKWNVPYKVILIHNAKANISNIRKYTDSHKEWRILCSEDLEKGDIYGTELDS